MNRRTFLIGALGSAAISTAPRSAYSYKGCSVASPFPPGSEFNELPRRFAELTHEIDPESELKVFPPGSVGSSQETLVAVQKGAINIGLFPASLLARKNPVFSGLSLPVLFSSGDSVQKAMDSEPIRDLLNSAAEHVNLRFLAFGWDVLMLASNRSGLEKISDVRGKKVRVIPSTTAWALELAGAQTVKIAYGETHAALQTGAIDAAVSTREAIEDLFSVEEIKAASDPREPFLGLYVVFLAIGAPSWARLSKPQSEVLQKAAKMAEHDFFAAGNERRAALAQRLVRQGVPLLRLGEEGVDWGSQVRDDVHTKFENQNEDNARLLSLIKAAT